MFIRIATLLVFIASAFASGMVLGLGYSFISHIGGAGDTVQSLRGELGRMTRILRLSQVEAEQDVMKANEAEDAAKARAAEAKAELADAIAKAAAASSSGSAAAAPASVAATTPSGPAARCLHLKRSYGVQPGMTWGSLTADGQAEWKRIGCDEKLPKNDGEPTPLRSEAPARWWATLPAHAPDGSANGSSTDGVYEPTWESLLRYGDSGPPQWFRDAKLGIFFHWGVYSVPAYGESGEWYPKFMYMDGRDEFRHHARTYGAHKTFGYKDFVPQFTAPKFDAEAWVRTAAAAGAKYVVPVAEHHDGFSMFNSSRNRWNAAAMGPRRDVCRELQDACRRRGLKFGVSSHRAYNWRFYSYRADFDTWADDAADLYSPRHAPDAPAPQWWLESWFARTVELIDYFKPDLLWFDWGWHWDEFAPWRPRVAAYYYNAMRRAGVEPVLNYKDKFPDGVAVWDIERGKASGIRQHHWQTDTSVSVSSWGYVEAKRDYKTVPSLTHDLIDIVSKNGNLLLNVGPRGDGSLPPEAAALLDGIGAWLAAHGEAIYATRPWRCYGEGAQTVVDGQMTERRNGGLGAGDVRYTVSTHDGGYTLYALLLAWPTAATATATATALLAALRGDEKVKGVTLLGHDAPLRWERARAPGGPRTGAGHSGGGALRVTLPSTPPAAAVPAAAFVLKLALEDEAARPTFGAGAPASTRTCLR